MTELDFRFLTFGIWGLGCALLYGIDLRRQFVAWRAQRDARARRELVNAFGLFLVALSSMLSIAFVLFGEAGTGIRGLFVALSLGAFFAVGVNKVLDGPKIVSRRR